MPQATLLIQRASAIHASAWITLASLPCSVGVAREGRIDFSTTFICPICGNASYRRVFEPVDARNLRTEFTTGTNLCANHEGLPPILPEDYDLAARLLDLSVATMEFLHDHYIANPSVLGAAAPSLSDL